MKTVHRSARALCFSAVAIGLLLPVGAQAQIISTKPKVNLPSPPELEVYTYRIYDDSVGIKDALKLVAAVRNNGVMQGSFDFALGSTRMDAVWFRASGTTLDGGERTLGSFSIPWQALSNQLGYSQANGWQDTCLGIFLVRQGSTDAWSDADIPNHRKRVCFKMYRTTR